MAAARGVKRYRVRLKASDPAGLRKAIGHRLTDEGMRLRHPQPPPIDTPVETQICYADGRIALTGHGWVSRVEGTETYLELEWDDGVDPEIAAWLAAGPPPPPAGRTVTLDELESPDEVPLIMSDPSSRSGLRLHPDLAWELARPLPGAEPVEPSAGDDPTQPIDLTRPLGAEPREEAPIPLTEVVEEGTLDLESTADLLPWGSPDAGSTDTDRHRALREVAELEVGAAPIAGSTDAKRHRALREVAELEVGAELELDLEWASELEPREVTPLARIDLVQREPSPRRPPSRSVSIELPEPLAVPEPTPPNPTGPIVAFDLGTSVTSVAVCAEPGDARLVPAESEGMLMPSIVAVGPEQTWAGAPALRVLAEEPGLGMIGVQRLLGRGHRSPVLQRLQSHLPLRLEPDPEGRVGMRVGERFVSIEEIAAVLLGRALRHAQVALGAEANRAVLTCPAYFGARQRSALVNAGRLAGLHVEHVVSCSMAAAVHHDRELELDQRRYLVFDLGAGTLDVSVIEAEGGHYRTLAAGGHAYLGGADFDAAVAQLLVTQLEDAGGRLSTRPGALTGVLQTAEGGKQALGEISRVHLPVSLAAADEATGLELEIARDDAEALWSTIVDRALEVARQVCARAGFEVEALDEVLVTGGQARAPYVQRRLARFAGRPFVLLEPASVVLGAAEIGRRLELETSDFSVQEGLSCSFGYGAAGGSFVPIARRGAPFPVEAEAWLDFAPAASPEILLFEGDQPRVEACEPYGRLCLDALPETIEAEGGLELRLRIDERGTVALQVFQASTATAIPFRLDPHVTEAQVARALAGGDGRDLDPVEAEPLELGFLDWVRRKLRG